MSETYGGNHVFKTYHENHVSETYGESHMSEMSVFSHMLKCMAFAVPKKRTIVTAVHWPYGQRSVSFVYNRSVKNVCLKLITCKHVGYIK